MKKHKKLCILLEVKPKFISSTEFNHNFLTAKYVLFLRKVFILADNKSYFLSTSIFSREDLMNFLNQLSDFLVKFCPPAWSKSNYRKFIYPGTHSLALLMCRWLSEHFHLGCKIRWSYIPYKVLSSCLPHQLLPSKLPHKAVV